MLLLVLLASVVRAQPHEGWGVRVGALMLDAYPGAHPVLEPYYESSTAAGSPLTMIGDLTLAWTDISSLQIPSYDEHTIQDYGFHGGVRYTRRNNETRSYFASFQFGFDVYPDPVQPDPGRVSASFPISAGVLQDWSEHTQLELIGTARPLWYFRQAWGFSYLVTIGLRFY